ncbi:hypothetical protein BDZ97DRAFT_840102 [Flammula alnicola]|nr:hypothetical protein BDZ97DRAFT_840102 [Flammula alnicola]
MHEFSNPNLLCIPKLSTQFPFLRMLFTAVKHSNNLQRYYPRRSYLPPVISGDPVHRLCTGYLQLHVGLSRHPSCHLLVPYLLHAHSSSLAEYVQSESQSAHHPARHLFYCLFHQLQQSSLYSQNAQHKAHFLVFDIFDTLEPSSAAYRLEGLGTTPINRPQPRPLLASLLIFIIL